MVDQFTHQAKAWLKPQRQKGDFYQVFLTILQDHYEVHAISIKNSLQRSAVPCIQ